MVTVTANKNYADIYPLTQKMIDAGIGFDNEKAQKLITVFQAENVILQRCILQEVSRCNIDPAAFNIDSNPDVVWLLFERKGLSTAYTTSGGALSTSAESLASLNDPTATAIASWRSKSRLIKKIEELLYYVKADGRIHATYDPFGTEAGGYTCSKPNLQNVAEELRQLFIAKSGHYFLSMDLCQIQYRIAAFLADEKDLIKQFEQGVDVHQLLADRLFISREKAKKLNYSIAYNMSTHSVALELHCSLKTAQCLIDSYFNSRPLFKLFKQQTKDFIASHGMIATLDGTIRKFGLDGPITDKDLERGFVTLIAGSAADIVKRLHRDFNAFIEHALVYKAEIQIVMNLHDQLIFEIKGKPDLSFITQLRSVVHTYPDFAVPLEATVTYGNTLSPKDQTECK